VCFGKSAIHGWGLFARRAIQEGEMVHTVLPTFPQYKLSMSSLRACTLNGTKSLGCVELLAFQKSSIIPFVFCEREKLIMFLKLVSLSSGFGVSGGACTAKCCRLARDSVQ
jgi:hypothetical protein